MANILNYLPHLETDEMAFIQGFFQNLNDQQAQQFADIYRTRRKTPELILFATLLGFVGFAGIQRFVIGSIGMGILYFFTAGLCFIGTIIDAINYRRLAFDYNIKEAQKVQIMVMSQMGGPYTGRY
ncbi:MAG: TM2 domain-containing protein [Bacteroidota bacterium]|nr:TM2 domain-containing protein [Bacteroidota bacterium]